VVTLTCLLHQLIIAFISFTNILLPTVQAKVSNMAAIISILLGLAQLLRLLVVLECMALELVLVINGLMCLCDDARIGILPVLG
jgi:hypothetical protein